MTRPSKIQPLAALVVAAIVAAAPAAYASSDFDAGVLQRRDPAIGTDLGFGLCRLFVGPRGAIPAGEFVLKIGDDDVRNGYELELRGQPRPTARAATRSPPTSRTPRTSTSRSCTARCVSRSQTSICVS